MFASILAAGLIGAVGGGLGGLLGALLSKAFSRTKPGAEASRKYQVGPVIGVVVGITLLNATGLRDRVARVIHPPSAVESFGLDLMSIPGVQERLRGKSPAEAQLITRNLSAAGMLKLDDAQLVSRAKTVSNMLAKTDERTCAGFAAGTISGDDFMKMMSSLSEEERGAWFKIVRAAVAVEVGAAAPTTQANPSPEQIALALADVQKQLSAAEQSRMTNGLSNLGKAPPAEACWTIRSLYSLVASSSGATQATLARALMMQ